MNLSMNVRERQNSRAGRDLLSKLRLPLIVAPMFKVSTPGLVAAACRSGAIGSMPSLNARTPEAFDASLETIEQALAETTDSGRVAPYAINLLTHASNARFVPDFEIAVRRRVPIIIASVGAPAAVVADVHAYGGLVFSDVASLRHARKAAEQGVDGLILLCAGAGGQTGRFSPFAFVEAVRQFFDGLIIVAGGITRGHHLRALEAMGADLGFSGTRFLTATENSATPAHRESVIASNMDDVWDTDAFSGIPTSVLRTSLDSSGLTPETRWVQRSRGRYDWSAIKGRKDVLSAGHGVGDVVAEETCEAILDRMVNEYSSINLLRVPASSRDA